MARDAFPREPDMGAANVFDELIALAEGELGPDSGNMRKLNTSVRETSAIGTLRKIKPVLPRFGVSQLIDITLDGVASCPVFQVVRDDARSQYFNAGKGYTRAESMVSGLMEALEVHCFEHADAALLHPAGELSIAERGLPVISAASLLGSRIDVVASTERATQVSFVRGYDHQSGSDVWIEARDVFFGLAAQGEQSAASSNGIASGNSVPEALCHAIGEILERHALAEFYRSGIGAKQFGNQQHERVAPPPGAVTMRRCLAQLKEKNITAEFLHLSSDAGVAVFICFLDIPFDATRRAAVEGFGAHPDPQIAMARALAEAVQILALSPVESVEDVIDDVSMQRAVMTSKQAAAFDSAEISRQRLHSHVALNGLRDRLELIDFDYLPIHDRAVEESRSTAQELEKLLDGLKSMGIDKVYSCVISPPDLPVVVVKCFCPGLDTVFGL